MPGRMAGAKDSIQQRAAAANSTVAACQAVEGPPSCGPLQGGGGAEALQLAGRPFPPLGGRVSAS
jgi:hypothetical protein